MPRAGECRVNGELVGIDEAIMERDNARQVGQADPDWRCVQCGRPVRPHRASFHGASHFEHLERNPNCSLSDPPR
jgi:hypothetical protein